jgi:hypothetical protein
MLTASTAIPATKSTTTATINNKNKTSYKNGKPDPKPDPLTFPDPLGVWKYGLQTGGVTSHGR